jgi:non-ribosomal peptide synthetase component F
MHEDGRARLVLAQAALAPRLARAVGSVLELEAALDACAEENDGNLEEPASSADLAYVIFTSGSSGRPKGAMNEHRGLCNKLCWLQQALALGPQDRFLFKTPIGFDVSVEEIFAPLISGGRLMIARPGGHRDPAYLASLIQERGITVVEFVPSMLSLFLEHPAAGACASIRHILSGGETLPADLMHRCLSILPGAELHNLTDRPKRP